MCIEHRVCMGACEREGESLGGTQGQMGEWEPGFCHSLDCGERRDTLSLCLICSPFLRVFR